MPIFDHVTYPTPITSRLIYPCETQIMYPLTMKCSGSDGAMTHYVIQDFANLCEQKVHYFPPDVIVPRYNLSPSLSIGHG